MFKLLILLTIINKNIGINTNVTSKSIVNSPTLYRICVVRELSNFQKIARK